MDPSSARRRARHIALLRGINVGGRHRVPMADLRDICAAIGWTAVETYIQSGNVVFEGAGAPAALEAQLEAAVADRFALSIPVIVRPARAWAAIAAGNPFPAATLREPQLVMLLLAKAPPRREAVEQLRQRATGGEAVERVGDDLWIHYASGAGRSRLTPALVDRCVGSPATARNWRTVEHLGTMAVSVGSP